MKIVVIPDSFKGSMSSIEAANAIERGIKKVIPGAEVVKLPVADGGEGTVDVFEYIGTGRVIRKEVTGPLGDPVQARYILTEKHMAVIEMAQASGLTLLGENQRNPMKTTSLGTGELIADAVLNGAKEVLLCIGGSATNDGGAGLARALGIRFADSHGLEIAPNCEGLRDLDHIDITGMNKGLLDVRIVIACDVQNTLCGPEGASYIYGPQKGADVPTAGEMDFLLNHMADTILKQFDREIRGIGGLGAAGGVAVPLVSFADAELVSGIDTILSCLEFEKHISDADYIFTGEGRLDSQTVYGKVISGILNRTKQKKVPVIAFCGILGEGYEKVVEAGMKSCFSIVPGTVPLSEAMEHAQDYLEDCAKRVAYLL